MGRKAVLEVCQACGGQARKINYTSSSKGKKYHYLKFVHANGIVHYCRQPGDGVSRSSITQAPKGSLFNALEEIVSLRLREKELRFGEIKSLLENSYGRPVVTATVYRNIKKLLKLDLMSKRTVNGTVLYGKKTGSPSGQEIKTTSMSIGFDFTHDETFVTMFVHIKNFGLGIIAGYNISLPMGDLNSLNQINLSAFDETKKITLHEENVLYSGSDRTGISITLNRPMRKSEERYLFLNYRYNFPNRPIQIVIPSDVDLLRINCEFEKGEDVKIKKRLSDGFREIEPVIIKRTGNDPGHIIFETEFENALRGDTIVISHSR
jgi:hypothetical protein